MQQFFAMREIVKRRITGAISSATCLATGLRFKLQEKLPPVTAPLDLFVICENQYENDENMNIIYNKSVCLL